MSAGKKGGWTYAAIDRIGAGGGRTLCGLSLALPRTAAGSESRRAGARRNGTALSGGYRNAEGPGRSRVGRIGGGVSAAARSQVKRSETVPGRQGARRPNLRRPNRRRLFGRSSGGSGGTGAGSTIGSVSLSRIRASWRLTVSLTGAPAANSSRGL